MKKIIFLNILISFLAVPGCKTIEEAAEVLVYKDSLLIHSPDQMTIHFGKGKSFNHPTFVVWEEDMNGIYQRTLFITESYASGIFGYRMIGDSVWLDKRGTSYQPAALPYWTYKKGLIDNEFLIPTPEHPFVDAFTTATPSNDFRFQAGAKKREDQYRIVVEVNQAWDWNSYWTNNKYPNSPEYKHSAQPSIIYAVIINQEDSLYHLNPIGHGDPKGESGKLFTDLSTLTSAKQIFKSVRIEIKR